MNRFKIMLTEKETFGSRSICMNIWVSVDLDILQTLLIVTICAEGIGRIKASCISSVNGI